MVLYINEIKITIKKEGCTVNESKYNCIFSTAENIDLDLVKGKVLILFPNARNTRAFFDKLESVKSRIKEVKVVTKSPKDFVKVVFYDHKTIKAGGGIVSNDSGDLLMIYRNGKWDFAKGKLDEGETLAECAVREVEEECGVKVAIESDLAVTRHTYKGSKDNVMKYTKWYEMTLLGDENKLIPQREEGIEKVEWKNREEAFELLKNSYNSLTWLLEKYYKLKGTNSFISLPNL